MVSFNPRIMSDTVARLATKPVAYTRLEPQSVSGDLRAGLEAAVHDPLWFLLRQWQFGEFLGEDNGRPLGVAVTWSTRKLSTLTVGADGASESHPIAGATLLDPDIEGAAAASTANVRARAEAGRALMMALAEAGLDASALPASFAFVAADIAAAPAALAPVLRAAPDAALVATALEGGKLPQFGAAAADWLGWYRAGIGRSAGASGWNRPRLEHAFRITTADGQRLDAAGHTGGAIDWWSFDVGTASPVGMPFPGNVGPGNLGGAIGSGKSIFDGDKVPAAFATKTVQSANLVAQPLRYPGMPADRCWEFEDGSVNLGGMDVEANDPARRALIEFATIYGNDWFTVPVAVPPGGVTTVESLSVTDSFGVTTPILAAADNGKGGPFRLFQLSRAGTAETASGLLTVPAARMTLDGEAIEATMLFRDEMANMGWAVEERVEDAAGRPRFRRDEPRVVVPDPQGQVAPTPPAGAPAPELGYTLETEVPPYWIPLVAVPTDGKGGFVLRKGTMTDADESRSRLLAGPGKVDIFDEELPEGGLRIERVPRIARASDGSLRRWTAFQVRAAGGSGASGLAFDQADPIVAT